NPDLSHTKSSPQEGHETFKDFILELLPMANEGITSPNHQQSSSALIQKVQKRLDFLLPFRSLAPTFVMAKSTILSNQERLNTRAGLFNLVAFRGVFYGSYFAKTDLRYFADLAAWKCHYCDAVPPDNMTKEAYYINKNCYGTAQAKRSVDVMNSYWEMASGWQSHLNGNISRDPLRLFEFFKTFKNIGDLSALLMVGDLADVGFIPNFEPKQMGKFVFQANKGARDGLHHLGLISSKADEAQVVQGFVDLHTFLEVELESEAKESIGYSVWMLEHALCKYKRLLKPR
ncbi:hypothetical protein CPB83DRAFT_727948, partial [Crepidotus variabilis]